MRQSAKRESAKRRPNKRRPNKWRPSLATITLAVMIAVLALPFAGIGILRLAENQLVRSTEAELIAQAAALAAAMAARLDEQGPTLSLGPPIPLPIRPPGSSPDEVRWNPTVPQLDLASMPILDRRPAARPAATPAPPAYSEAGAWLDPILAATQRATLAGFRVTDPDGTVVAGRDEVGLSLAHLPELSQALGGRASSALRRRVVDNPQPIYSISRGTTVRVFVALPVVVRGRVAGAIYVSRTPSNILKELYGQRWRLLIAGLAVVGLALLLGLVLLRAIVVPVRELTNRTRRIEAGDRTAIRPLRQYGSRELHALSTGLLAMARRIVDRSDTLVTFATHVSHELKSPLAGIRGAVELLADDDLSPAERLRFRRNVEADIDRMALLLDRMREMARTEHLDLRGACDLRDCLMEASASLSLEVEAPSWITLPMSREAASIVFSNLAENAVQHSATRLHVTATEVDGDLVVDVADDGAGISAGNRDLVFDLFHTTRRDAGGTGMGLAIIRSVLHALGGTIILLEAERGATFRIALPLRATGTLG